MEQNKGELIPVNNSKLPAIREATSRIGKITKYSVLTAGFAAGTLISVAVIPALAVPAIAGLAYNGQKLLNNTMYKGYDDLAFITRKGSNNTIKIFQDWTRNDITKNIKNYSNIEKAGFMQLQAIIGMSKFKKEDKKGNILTYSTRSHGITRNTLKKLEDLGYIDNYEEEPKREKRLIIPKIAFGNFKGLKDKVQMYDIKFNLTGKQLDITDSDLQKSFPTVFGRRGIIQRRGYQIVPDGKGGLTFKIDEEAINRSENQSRAKLIEDLREKGVPTYKEQAINSKKIIANQKETIQERDKTQEDKQL